MWRRSISILRPSPTTVIPSNILTESQLDVKTLFETTNEDSLETTSVTTTEFQLLGDNPTLASVQVSASIPLYVNRHCLVSIHDSNRLDNVNVSLTRWFTFWPTFSLSRFNKLIGTDQFHCLVSSKKPSDTLSLLQLNGTHDWVVFRPSSIISFEENSSLSIQWYHKWLNYLKWMTNSINSFSSYGKVSGRGNILLNGVGSIYKLELKSEEEQILLQKSRILAINGLNKLDFKNAITFEQSSKNITEHSLSTNVENTNAGSHTVTLYKKTVAMIKNRWRNVNNSDFVRIKGPRTVLVQTGSKNSNFQIWSRTATAFQSPSKNYLSFASIKEGKVHFKNTSSFVK